MLDPNELSKWNCIIEPKVRGNKSYSGLYIGDIDCAKDQYLLQKLQIGAILSVIDYPEVTLPDIYAHSKICISDSEAESLSDHFPSCFDFIENNRQHTNVMVHCYAGISRSATVVLAYMMKHFRWNLDRAYQILWCLRKQILPNEGFMKQLKAFEQHLFGNQIDDWSQQSIQQIPNKPVPDSNQYLKQVEIEIEERQRNLEILKQKFKQIKNLKKVPQYSRTDCQ